MQFTEPFSFENSPMGDQRGSNIKRSLFQRLEVTYLLVLHIPTPGISLSLFLPHFQAHLAPYSPFTFLFLFLALNPRFLPPLTKNLQRDGKSSHTMSRASAVDFEGVAVGV